MLRMIISEPSLILKKTLNQYVDEAISEKDDFNYCVFDFEENPLDEILDALETPAFGSDKKVVICKNPYFLKDEKFKLPFNNDLSKLEKYLYNENPDSVFIIITPNKYYNPKSKYLTIFSKVGHVDNLLFADENEFREYGMALIKGLKLDIDNKAIDILFERCITDVCKLEREITKLSLYGDKISQQVIEQMVSRPLEDDVFELSNALLSKDRKNIMKIYNDLKLLKIEPIMLISMLANQFRLILQVGILKRQRKQENEIATILAVHPYRVKLALKNLNNYSIESIKNILVELATLDAEIKSGIRDRYVDFELFLSTK